MFALGIDDGLDIVVGPDFVVFELLLGEDVEEEGDILNAFVGGGLRFLHHLVGSINTIIIFFMFIHC